MGRASAASAATISLRAVLASGMRPIAAFDLGCRHIEIAVGRDSIWAIIRRSGRGGVALRMAHCWGGCTKVSRQRRKAGEEVRLRVEGATGIQTVVLRTNDVDLSLLRVTTTLTPTTALLVPYFPRDLYPLGEGDDPMTADGRVEAAQRGLNVGLCYFHLQNLTALNDYFAATDTKPDAAVGGEWPELGYLPPTPPQSGTPPTNPLPAGKAVTMSDALLVFHDDSACDEQDSARRFLQLLGAAYRQIEPPRTEYRDWVWRADKTLHDLETAPEATIRHYGHTYIHPYTAAEYPDIMVQMSIIASLRDYASWTMRDIPFRIALENGLGKFHDRTLKTMRRYLPNVGKDKDKLAVDSWYLYHPLLNLGRLALARFGG
jgi:hypothetical protein